MMNNISYNTNGLVLDEGMYPIESSENQIYLNSFVQNRNDVVSYISSNFWSSPTSIRYIYRGRSFESRMGNYWHGFGGTGRDAMGYWT